MIIGTRGYLSHQGGYAMAVRKLALCLVYPAWGVTAYGRVHTRQHAFNTAFSSVTLVMLSPVLLAFTIAIKLGSRRPMGSRQDRVGSAGFPFIIHEPRCVSVDVEVRLGALRLTAIDNSALLKLQHDLRATRVGGRLRGLSLGELPQFWTALPGHVSVGPRPHPARIRRGPGRRATSPADQAGDSRPAAGERALQPESQLRRELAADWRPRDRSDDRRCRLFWTGRGEPDAEALPPGGCICGLDLRARKTLM